MAIPVGQRLGPYEILSAISAGGKGEVYRARDTRLDRTVAIKVLPSHLADKPELRERFEREALVSKHERPPTAGRRSFPAARRCCSLRSRLIRRCTELVQRIEAPRAYRKMRTYDRFYA